MKGDRHRRTSPTAPRTSPESRGVRKLPDLFPGMSHTCGTMACFGKEMGTGTSAVLTRMARCPGHLH